MDFLDPNDTDDFSSILLDSLFLIVFELILFKFDSSFISILCILFILCCSSASCFKLLINVEKLFINSSKNNSIYSLISLGDLYVK